MLYILKWRIWISRFHHKKYDSSWKPSPNQSMSTPSTTDPTSVKSTSPTHTRWYTTNVLRNQISAKRCWASTNSCYSAIWCSQSGHTLTPTNSNSSITTMNAMSCTLPYSSRKFLLILIDTISLQEILDLLRNCLSIFCIAISLGPLNWDPTISNASFKL